MRTHFHFFPRFLTRVSGFLVVSFAVLALQASMAQANSKYAGIVMDAKTGRILYSYKSDERRYPASLTKMMTLYLIFEALEQRKITRKTRIRMSRRAASNPPSKLGIKPGSTLSIQQVIYALAIKSANDVAAAVAEHLGGSEKKFARRMTQRARQLGMHHTTFRNASGLTAKGQVTTAKDMALLGIALREHYPQYYRYFSKRLFKYGKNRYANHNRLLGRVKGVDGIKTGYTQLSGYNLVSSVQSNGRSIVAVVIGGKSGKSRNAQMQKLISRHMKKATRRKKRNILVAKTSILRAPDVLLAKAVVLPSSGPVPLFRAYHDKPGQKRIKQNEIMNIAYAPIIRRPHQKSIEAIRGKLIAVSTNQTSLLQTIPIAKPDDIVTSSVRLQKISPSFPANMEMANVYLEKALLAKSRYLSTLTHSSKSPAGWHIQIGAVPDRSKALLLLAKVRKKMFRQSNGQIFDKLINYLEPVVKNNQTLYRARFAGFHDKTGARSVCRVMKKQRIPCLAIKG